ncbi:MAG TPA: helix-turn-helix domain-containing protein [Baekduia sp.]
MAPTGDAYVELAPPPALARHVEHLWVHRIVGPPPPGGRRLLPDGRVNLVWIAGLGVRVAGPSQTFLRPPPLSQMLAFGASFRPGAAPYLLRTDARELVDVHVHLAEVESLLARRIDERLSAAVTPDAALRAFAGELARHLTEAEWPDATVQAAIAILDAPAATVADAAAATHVSERELHRRFVRDVGYAPKTLQRVLRFQRFMDLLQLPHVLHGEPAGARRPAADLARVAAIAGYADQSHLSREARKIAGLSPRQLLDYRH